MSDAPLPDTWDAAVRWFLGTTIVFALGFEGITMLLAGKFVLGAGSILLALGLTAFIVYWPVGGSAILLMAGLPILLFLGTVEFCKRYKFGGPKLLIVGVIMLVAAVALAGIGGALIFVSVSKETVQTTSNPPPQSGPPMFAEAHRPARTIPSKNYSTEEKQKLLGLIGTISTLLNDKGLPAVQIARGTGYNAVGPSIDVLEDAIKRAESVRGTLADIQRTIYNDILQPKNSNVLADLKYITENNANLDQFQRATEGFSNNIENFKRNFDSISQDQRNWITSLIQSGVGQIWAHSAEDFEGWVQQCNSRMDAEREGLK